MGAHQELADARGLQALEARAQVAREVAAHPVVVPVDRERRAPPARDVQGAVDRQAVAQVDRELEPAQVLDEGAEAKDSPVPGDRELQAQAVLAQVRVIPVAERGGRAPQAAPADREPAVPV